MLRRLIHAGSEGLYHSKLGSGATATAARRLNIHECDSYELLHRFGVRTPRGVVAYSPHEAKLIAKAMGTPKFVVKAQVLAGGRGFGHFDNGFQGGVHIVNSPGKVADVVSKMVGHNLITKQTGKQGRPVNKVMIVEPVPIVKEYYLALVLDRKHGGVVMVGCAQGGQRIEDVAARDPDAIKRVPVDIIRGMTAANAEAMAEQLGIDPALTDQCVDQFLKLYSLMVKLDATQIEINPLVATSDGRLLCADAKLNFDDNAAFRQQQLFDRRDITQENPRDVEAQEHDLSYVGLDGHIGCMVNGAGLAMATMDLLHLYQGKPANFLDVGGSADETRITEAFKIITADPNVRAIFVNIFGGIMSCRTIASGIVSALDTVAVSVPIVVRLRGTEMSQGEQILAAYSGRTPIFAIPDFDNAAKCAVFFSKHIQMPRILV
eukprot:TRINITY_DN7479_c0_g1_i1.p2 TRINITY_DN7479_c0_g1~~TRINITY_DN7479_c0_g1_i1.p2  ORF type:complete len:434 (+),score=116.49 TRINITY_DN7479_c0_g1_i1:185-1486(+)